MSHRLFIVLLIKTRVHLCISQGPRGISPIHAPPSFDLDHLLRAMFNSESSDTEEQRKDVATVSSGMFVSFRTRFKGTHVFHLKPHPT